MQYATVHMPHIFPSIPLQQHCLTKHAHGPSKSVSRCYNNQLSVITALLTAAEKCAFTNVGCVKGSLHKHGHGFQNQTSRFD